MPGEHVHRHGRRRGAGGRHAALRRRQRRHAAHDAGHAAPRRSPRAPGPSSSSTCTDRCLTWPACSPYARTRGILVIEDAAQAHGAEWDGPPGRLVRRGRLLQLLPGQEPRRVRRRRARWSRPGQNSPTGSGRWPITAGPTAPSHYEHELVGTQQPPGRPAGDRAVRASWPGWTRGPNGGSSWPPGTARRLAAPSVRLPASRRRRATSTTCSSCGCRGRDRVRAELGRRGIQTGVHYPVPCHLQPPLRRFADRPAAGGRAGGGRDAVAADVPAHDRRPGRRGVRRAQRGRPGRGRPGPELSQCPLKRAASAAAAAMAADEGVIAGYPVSRGRGGPLVLGRRRPAPVRNCALRRHDDRAAPADRARRRHPGRMPDRRRRLRSGAIPSWTTAAASVTG